MRIKEQPQGLQNVTLDCACQALDPLVGFLIACDKLSNCISIRNGSWQLPTKNCLQWQKCRSLSWVAFLPLEGKQAGVYDIAAVLLSLSGAKLLQECVKVLVDSFTCLAASLAYCQQQDLMSLPQVVNHWHVSTKVC